MLMSTTQFRSAVLEKTNRSLLCRCQILLFWSRWGNTAVPGADGSRSRPHGRNRPEFERRYFTSQGYHGVDMALTIDPSPFLARLQMQCSAGWGPDKRMHPKIRNMQSPLCIRYNLMARSEPVTSCLHIETRPPSCHYGDIFVEKHYGCFLNT